MARLQLFKYMLLEDWRQHSNLFGGARFAAFPVQIGVMVAAATWLLTLTTIDPNNVILGIHVLVFLFGVQTGSTAFEGSNALENVLGDVTYIMFSTRTLPVNPRTLFGIFIVKDIVYYTALFILPVTLGLIPFYSATTLPLTVPSLATLLGSLVVMFLFGAAAAVFAVTLATGDLLRRVVGGVGAVAAGAFILTTNASIVTLTPYGLHTATSATDAAQAVLPTIGTVAAAVLLYTPSTRPRNRTASLSYDWLRAVIPDRIGLLPVKIVMDVKRSSGGVLKVVFIAGLFFTVTAFLVWAVENALRISLNPGIAFGALLSLTAFTTHTFVTQLDDPEEYLFHPLTVYDVFTAKYIAFTVFTVPVGVIFYGAALLYRQPGLVDAALGAVIFTALAVYVFGVTVYVAGLDPNDFMFNTTAFATFGLAIMLAILPVLIASFITPITTLVATGLVVWSILLASIGGVACWAAPSRWTTTYH